LVIHNGLIVSQFKPPSLALSDDSDSDDSDSDEQHAFGELSIIYMLYVSKYYHQATSLQNALQRQSNQNSNLDSVFEGRPSVALAWKKSNTL
jgi:hypothetical protein